MSNKHKRDVGLPKEDLRGGVQEAKCAELRDCRIVQGGSGCLTGIREMLAPLKKTLEEAWGVPGGAQEAKCAELRDCRISQGVRMLKRG